MGRLPVAIGLGRGHSADEMLRRLGAAIAIIDAERSPLSPDMLAGAVATLQRGQTVLVIAARREDRDFARVQIVSIACAKGGSA